jgi:Mn2+/Fe2+ NRAMP family transporter
MGLVIQIGFGIVLGWYLITRFEKIKAVIFSPFKFLWWIAKKISLILFNIIYAISKELAEIILKVLPYIIFLLVTVAVLGGVGLTVIKFELQDYFGTSLVVIFALFFVYAVYVMFKESYENYKSKTTNDWMVAGILGLLISFALVGALYKFIEPYVSN